MCKPFTAFISIVYLLQNNKELCFKWCFKWVQRSNVCVCYRAYLGGKFEIRSFWKTKIFWLKYKSFIKALMLYFQKENIIWDIKHVFSKSLANWENLISHIYENDPISFGLVLWTTVRNVWDGVNIMGCLLSRWFAQLVIATVVESKLGLCRCWF